MNYHLASLVSNWGLKQKRQHICMMTSSLSVLLALCVGNSPVTGEFPAQRPVTWSFDVFFVLRLNKQLSKQSWGWWFETPLLSLWCHSNILSVTKYLKLQWPYFHNDLQNLGTISTWNCHPSRREILKLKTLHFHAHPYDRTISTCSCGLHFISLCYIWFAGLGFGLTQLMKLALKTHIVSLSQPILCLLTLWWV